MEFNSIKPLGLKNISIEVIVNVFSKLIDFNPLGYDFLEIIEMIGGSIEYTNSNNLEFCMGGIEVFSKRNFKIYISSNISEDNLNFTIAHELGHYVLHSLMGEVPIKSDISKSGNIFEKEANTFAVCFLLPRNTFIREFYACKGSIKDLSCKFNVSTKLIKIRCNNLNLW